MLTPQIAANQQARIEVDVANTGSRAGDEVVQLYIHDDEASVTRPVIELKRFQRVTLQPGERRTISFDVTPDDLALWNPGHEEGRRARHLHHLLRAELGRPQEREADGHRLIKCE